MLDMTLSVDAEPDARLLPKRTDHNVGRRALDVQNKNLKWDKPKTSPLSSEFLLSFK